AAAGIAFAMQEVIGAIAGWFNITSGRIYRIGDRVELGGVRGDVIDVTLLRTKMLEIGSAEDDKSWVKGRQHTGRIVAVSNKAAFTRRIRERLDDLGIEIASETEEVTVSYRDGDGNGHGSASLSPPPPPGPDAAR